MKKFLKLILSVFSALILSGCSQKEAVPLCRVVTQVDIFCQHEDVQIRRHYTDSQKMEYVLLYLRHLKPKGIPATDPDTVDADVYNITLLLSDGNEKAYKQKDHRYLYTDTRSWRTIDPEQAAGLYQLMLKIPSDQM